MSWEYEYDSENDETKIKYNGRHMGVVNSKITSWRSGMPLGDAKEIIKDAVDDPMVVDLLYGFSKAESDEDK